MEDGRPPVLHGPSPDGREARPPFLSYPEQHVKRRSPTLEGFQTMFRLPLLGLAEISWRWSFGLAATAALLFSLREYLATLPVTASEMLLLRTGQSTLVLQALARIFQGSAPRATVALVVLTLALTGAWIVVASVGRAVTLKTLLEYFRGSGRGELAALHPAALPISASRGLTSLLFLNSLRAATLLAAIVGLVGAMLIAGAASSPDDPSPAKAVLIFWLLTMLIGLAWPLLNWYLSLAALFVVRDGASAFSALAKATDLCRTRPGALAAAGTWFGLAHVIVFGIASSAAAVPLGIAEVLPGGMVLGGLLLVSLLYFAAVDFLYVGRLSTYMFLLEQPERGPEPSALPAPPDDDDILSDIPGLVPPLEAAGS